MKTSIKRLLTVASRALCVTLPLLASTSIAHATTAIFAPGDTVSGGQLQGNNFVVGTTGNSPNTNNWPGSEGPANAIDGGTAKYLNFAETNTGLVVTPTFGSSVVTSLQVTTANDVEFRDPASFALYGSNATLGSGPFSLADFMLIASGDLALPSQRFSSQTVNFANALGFTSYMIIFPTVKNAAGANSMQISEVQLFGIATPAPVPEPGTLAVLAMGLAGLGLARRRVR